jgi:hypothetical protein
MFHPLINFDLIGDNSRMRISKSLKWMIPYIEDARPILPELALLTHLISRVPKVNKKEVQRISGICNQYEKKDKSLSYRIILMTKYQNIQKYRPLKIKLSDYSKLDMLHLLAHELSHMRDMTHTPSRMVLECRLMLKFMKRLESEGYISEEHESKNKKNVTSDSFATI